MISQNDKRKNALLQFFWDSFDFIRCFNHFLFSYFFFIQSYCVWIIYVFISRTQHVNNADCCNIYFHAYSILICVTVCATLQHSVWFVLRMYYIFKWFALLWKMNFCWWIKRTVLEYHRLIIYFFSQNLTESIWELNTLNYECKK